MPIIVSTVFLFEYVLLVTHVKALNADDLRVGFDVIHGTGHARSHELEKFAEEFLSRK